MRIEPVTTLPEFASTPYLSYLAVESSTVFVSLGGLDLEDTREHCWRSDFDQARHGVVRK